MQTDVVIIGAGPAGIFTALEMLRKGSNKRIVLVEKGRAIEKRSCPKKKTGHCVQCPNCHITTGFSGAGAFSDGKLSLSCEVGGELPELIGRDAAQALIDYTDGIYLEFGADTRIEGVGQKEEVKDIRKKAIRAGLKLVDCPIRHLGTEKAQEIYLAIERHLAASGVELLFGVDCLDLIVEEGRCAGVTVSDGGRSGRFARRASSSRPGAGARRGSRGSARSTGLRISPARWTSAFGSSCATRSWRTSTTCSMNPS